MLGLAQNATSADLRLWGELTQEQQQPIVIRSHRQTDAEMIAELLKKLPVPAPNHIVAGGVNSRDISPHACAVEVPSTCKNLAGMAQKSIAVIPPQPLHFGFQAPPGLHPPPGLEHCHAHARQTFAHLQQNVDVGPMCMRDIYGISKMADEEQCSTNDDGEHAACESLPSEDDVAHAHTFRSPALGRGMTTLMIRNVPVMYTQRLLLKEWENEGAYDFLYLPVSSVEQKNLSYAFINFASEAHAMAFKEKWHKKRMARFTARKPLNISFADVQGLRANVLQVTRRRVASSEAPRHQPYVFINGKCVDPQEALAVMQF